jgi:D-hydroxyproline dehydrogenase subunit gamma
MSHASIRLWINKHQLDVPAGITVAAAIAQLGPPCRRSVSGQWRAPFCGMGVCFECRVTIDGNTQQRACMILVRDGMQVSTDD